MKLYAKKLRIPHLLCLLALATLIIGSGCNRVKETFGGRTVEDPEEDSPEWIVQQVLKAASIDDAEESWKEYRIFLHSKEQTTQGLKDWQRMRYPALRRKYECFVENEGNFTYTIKRTDEVSEDEIHLYVKCSTSDMPTPCKMQRDPKDDDEWRIRWNCLN